MAEKNQKKSEGVKLWHQDEAAKACIIWHGLSIIRYKKCPSPYLIVLFYFFMLLSLRKNLVVSIPRFSNIVSWIPRCTYILFIHLSSLSLSLCMCHSIFLTLYIFSQHYLSVLSKWPPSPMWPALAKFHHFGNFLIGSLSILEQFWTYFGQLFMLLGKLS